MEKSSTFEQSTELKAMMNQYFKDDNVAFTNLDDKLNGIDVKFTKMFEVIRLNGVHFSSVVKDIGELKKTVTDHITEIAPILQNYNDMQATKRTLAKYGKGAIFLGGVTGAWIAIKNFILR